MYIIMIITIGNIIIIAQVLHRISYNYLVLESLEVIASLYVLLFMIGKVSTMMHSRIMTFIIHARVMPGVTCPVVTACVVGHFAFVLIAGPVALYVLAVPWYLIVAMRLERSMMLRPRIAQMTKPRSQFTQPFTCSLQISLV